jgi:cytochrome c oxidase subunit 1
MLMVGLQGMVRRVSSYEPQYAGLNIIASLGAFLLGVSTLPFIANMVGSWLAGAPAPDNPWYATGLEWTVSSPPPRENFEEIPTVTLAPYSYGQPQFWHVTSTHPEAIDKHHQ